MTNTNDPLPAIQLDLRTWQAALLSMGGTQRAMTLAHLVAVLAALTPEQRDVCAAELFPMLHAANEAIEKEKARAERAEQRVQGAVEFLRNYGDYLLRRPISNPAALALIALKKELGIDV